MLRIAYGVGVKKRLSEYFIGVVSLIGLVGADITLCVIASNFGVETTRARLVELPDLLF